MATLALNPAGPLTFDELIQNWFQKFENFPRGSPLPTVLNRVSYLSFWQFHLKTVPKWGCSDCHTEVIVK